MSKIKKLQNILKINIEKIIFSGILFGIHVCNGQNFTISEKTDISLPILNNTLNYTIYPDNLIITGVYKFSNESLNKFPEDVLVSTLSANNYNWEQSNYTYQIKSNPKKYNCFNTLFPSCALMARSW